VLVVVGVRHVHLADPGSGEVPVHLGQHADLEAPVRRNAQGPGHLEGHGALAGQRVAEAVQVLQVAQSAEGDRHGADQGRHEQPGDPSVEALAVERILREEYEVVADDLVGLDQANLKLEGQRLGYMYQTPRVSGTLRIVRRPARLSAESLTVARLDRETLSAHLESHLDIQGGQIGSQAGRIMGAFEELLPEINPNLVLVVGDVNSTLAAAYVAKQHHIPAMISIAGLFIVDSLAFYFAYLAA